MKMHRNFKFLIFFLLIFVLLMVKCEAWKKSEASCTNNYNNKLQSLINLLCNNTQTTSIQVRDGCYGCFFRATSLPNGQAQISALSQCGVLYLANTTYANCVAELAAIANGSRPTTAPTAAGCYTGYCGFVQCVRRVNANNLIDLCFQENLAGFNMTNKQSRIYTYTNTTSCILARLRCSRYNPISGELQNQVGYSQTHSFGKFGNSLFSSSLAPFSNSLQIAPNGDLRVLALPSTVKVGELFCSRTQRLDQSSYREFIC